jgi:hypothetical protein
LYIFAFVLFVAQIWSAEALAQSSYFGSQGCSACHVAPVVTSCNGCHVHGTHAGSGNSAVNVAGTTDKSSYAPGELVTVTISGGYRSGWFRALLYDHNMVELARSTGNASGMGSATSSPAKLSYPAPTTPGTYTWKVAWYGSNAEASTTAFGSGWTPDPLNPNHGAEIVSITTPFIVAAPTLSLPTLSSIAPSSLVRGAENQTLTLTGNNLGGATVLFSNAGVTGGQVIATATSLRLPVSIAATATTGIGTLTVVTATGSVSGFFSVTAAAIPAPAISSVSPVSLVQGAVNQVVTITGTNLAGATVSFSNTGVIGGPASVSATAISLPVIVAADAPTGPGTITVTTVGGTAASAFSLTPRSAAPALVISALADGSYTNNATLNISGSASADTGIKSVIINNQFATVMPNGFFSTALALIPGANRVTVIVTDNAGSLKSDVRTINYDPVGPILTVDTPADNSTSAASFLTVSGNVNETSTVVVTNNSGSSQVASMSGNIFSLTVNLEPGVNTINLVAYDLAGNIASAKRTVIYDALSLSLAVTNPAQDMTTERSTLNFMGAVTGGASDITLTISMDNQTFAPLVTNGIFNQLLTFTADKLYVISVVARDAAGNSSTVTRNIIYRPVEVDDGSDGSTGHPFGWSNPRSSHQDYADDNGVDECLSCHSINSSSADEPMSCYNCHGKEWDTPSGGDTTSHPFGWSNPRSSHQDYADDNGVDECLSCHSIDSSSEDEAMSCYNCHGKEWDTPRGGNDDDDDRTTSHPFGWSNPRSSHQDYADDNGVDECLSCHSTDSSSEDEPMSCYNCHGKEW